MEQSDEALFVRVVEAGSLKQAARQLGVNPSTVSRRLAGLEARLGIQLLQRSTRRTAPTDAGARYYEGLRRLIAQQRALEAQISGTAETPRGRLRVTASVDFGPRFVVPVFARLYAQAPELEMQLVLGSNFADLTERGIDVAVRIGALPDSALIARKVGAVSRVLVASPAYLAQHGTPNHPFDLAAHAFVFYKRKPGTPTVTLTATDGERYTVPVRGRLTVNSVVGVRRLVEAGCGLHLGPTWAFAEGLAAGRLTALLPDYQLRAYPLHALYVPTPYVPAKIRVFIDTMIEIVGEDLSTIQNRQ